MYRSSPFRSTLNTSYITCLDMCKVCTEAVHSVALWTRVTSLVWTCVKYVPKQSIPWHFENVPFYTYGFQSVSKNMAHSARLSSYMCWCMFNLSQITIWVFFSMAILCVSNVIFIGSMVIGHWAISNMLQPSPNFARPLLHVKHHATGHQTWNEQKTWISFWGDFLRILPWYS